MSLVALGVALIVLAGLAAAAFARRPVVGEALFRVLLGAGCVAGAIPALAVLAGATLPDVRLAPVTPLGTWVFGLDALSAVFLLAILSVGAACAFFGLTYLAHERTHRAIGAAHLLFALLVASLVLVVVARGHSSSRGKQWPWRPTSWSSSSTNVARCAALGTSTWWRHT